MRSLSISFKLAAWYACSMLLGLVVFGVVMWFVLASSMLSWKDRTLQMRASRVETVLSVAEAVGRPQQSIDARLSDLLGSLPEGEWIQLTRWDGARVFPRSPLPPGMPQLPFTPCPSPALRDLLVAREHFRQLCHPITYMGQPAVLLVPSPLAEDQILLRAFTLGLYRLIPLILVVSGIGGYILSQRVLRPVDHLIAEARLITALDLGRRLTVPKADDQIRSLALAWNDLLARIEAAVIRITQFTADASHELRNPIAYIRTAAEYSFSNAEIDEESREAFRAIAEEASLTGKLLENLLILAHPEERPSYAELEPVDVSIATEDLIRHFAPLVQKKYQTLSVMTPGLHPTLLINPLHLRRLVSAILDNAIKYTPEKGRISIRYDSSDGFTLQIIDTGIGIAEQHLYRVFDRFFRVDTARSDVSDGVGLGLPIAKWLTERYGGNIRIESEVGRGTAVTLVFPKNMVLEQHIAHRVTPDKCVS